MTTKCLTLSSIRTRRSKRRVPSKRKQQVGLQAF